jgi:DNA-binding NtrC family response regulator
MAIEKTLVLEPDPVLRQDIAARLTERGVDATCVDGLSEGLARLDEEPFDLIITEAQLPDGNDAELFAQLHGRPGAPAVVVLASFASAESAVAALRHGAFVCLPKPFAGADLAVVLRRAGEHQRWQEVHRRLSRGGGTEPGLDLLGRCPAIDELRKTIRRISHTEATVLIQGEPGTGRTFAARLIHRESPRAGAPFLMVDCATLLPERLTLELFGADPGGLPGVTRRYRGLMELAHGGTLLLQEVGLLPGSAQERLLQIMRDQHLTPFGSQRTLECDVRLLASSSRDLDQKVKAGEFREDLAIALSAVNLQLPPLRERGPDLALLAEHFRQYYTRQHGAGALAFSPACLAALEQLPWPGNVRELQSLIERAVLACGPEGVLEPHHLQLGPPPLSKSGTAAAGGLPSLEEVEKEHILKALDHCHGSRIQAAEILGISVRTLRNKLKAYRTAASDTSVTKED